MSRRPALRMPTVEQDQVITAAAKSEPDALPLSPEQLKAMVPTKALRGRPKATSKKPLVQAHYSPEVIAYFKSTGKGWQSLIDNVLWQYVEQHSRNSSMRGLQAGVAQLATDSRELFTHGLSFWRPDATQRDIKDLLSRNVMHKTEGGVG